jgi:hypothetical protein
VSKIFNNLAIWTILNPNFIFWKGNYYPVILHWLFELFFRLFPKCWFTFRKKFEQAEADDNEVAPEEDPVSSEPEEPQKIELKPPMEIVIPAAGVLVEKGNEYEHKKDIVVDNEKKEEERGPIEEVKIAPQNVEDDEEMIIDNNQMGETIGNLANEATTNTFYGPKVEAKSKGM